MSWAFAGYEGRLESSESEWSALIKDPKLCAPVIFTGHSAFSPWKHSNFDRTSEASADFKWSEPEQCEDHRLDRRELRFAEKHEDHLQHCLHDRLVPQSFGFVDGVF